LHPNLNVVQGDIYNLPFQEGFFDFVFCFGVLQHTPNVKKAFMSLPPQLKKGGHLAVDVYRKRLRMIFWSKYWVRPFTCRMEPTRLFKMVEKWVPVLLPISIFIGRIPFVGRKLRYLIPVANYDGIFPLTNNQILEWAILDTFDMLSPVYDQPQSAATLYSWLKEAGMVDIKVFHPAHLVGQGRKP
jgi:SAM-dependent methyltransferase